MGGYESSAKNHFFQRIDLTKHLVVSPITPLVSPVVGPYSAILSFPVPLAWHPNYQYAIVT